MNKVCSKDKNFLGVKSLEGLCVQNARPYSSGQEVRDDLFLALKVSVHRGPLRSCDHRDTVCTSCRLLVCMEH